MRKFITLLLLASFSTTSFSQTIDSIFQYRSNVSSSVEAIATDQSGNVFVAGYFEDSMWANNRYLLDAYQTARVMFVASYTSSGVLRFSKLIYNILGTPIKLKTDTKGNVYLSSNFKGKVYLDSDNLKDLINATINTGSFILKMDNNGANLWNVYIAPNSGFSDMKTIDFVCTPYDEILWMVTGKGDMRIQSSDGLFVDLPNLGNKNSNKNGLAILRSKQGGYRAVSHRAVYSNTGYDLQGGGLVELNGNLVFSGELYGTMDFDPGNGVSSLTGSGLVLYCSLDTAMNFNWVQKSGHESLIKLEKNSYGQIRGYGSHSGVGIAYFEFTNLEFSGQINWEKQESFSSGYLDLTDMSADQNGNMFVTGTFQGSGDLDPTNTTAFIGAGKRANFIVKYDSSGAVLWNVAGLSNTDFVVKGLAVDICVNNQLYWGGTYKRDIIFSQNSKAQLPYTSYLLGFMAQFTECRTFQPKINFTDSSVCTGNTVFLEIKGAGTVTWEDNKSLTPSRNIMITKDAVYRSTVYNDSGCSKKFTINFKALPLPVPQISTQGDSVKLSGKWKKVEWYLDGIKVSNASMTGFKPEKSGKVKCLVTDLEGCEGFSSEINYTSAGLSEILTTLNMYSYNGKVLRISETQSNSPKSVSIYDLQGRLLLNKSLIKKENYFECDLDLPNAMFVFLVLDNKGTPFIRGKILNRIKD
ncbi:MAG: hypothetical protein H6605_07830 [Flavobacteriales bacterium]|nr:hypothetical protein [Flavobacteriales bacterium]